MLNRPDVIITDGANPILWFINGVQGMTEVLKSLKIIDTTGAGDAFNGGLAFGLLKEKPIKECLELANKIAGLSTTKLGAGNAMPYLKEIN